MSRQQKALCLMSKQGQFELIDLPIPSPGPGEVLIKIQAIGLNPMEPLIQKSGRIVEEYPAILGIDASGDVEDLGEGVEGFVKGDRVLVQPIPAGKSGGYQQYTVIPANAVTKIPSKLSYAEAASIPATFLTAAVGLLAAKPEGAGLNPTLDPTIKYTGEPALVMGGSTSVGQYAIQILKYLDFSPIIAYASSKHYELLESLGATHIIDRNTIALQDFPAAIRSITSEPLKLAYVSTGGQEATDAAWASLAEGGQLPCCIPVAWPESVDGKRSWFIWGSCYDAPPDRTIRKGDVPKTSTFGLTMMKGLEKWLEDGVIKPNNVKILPNGLAGILAGHEEQMNGKVSAFKLVVLPQDTP